MDYCGELTTALGNYLAATGAVPEGAFVTGFVVVARWDGPDGSGGISGVPSMGMDPTAQASLLRDAQAAAEAR